MRTLSTQHLSVLFLLCTGAAAHAQAVPDAGALRQQIERGLPAPMPERGTQALLPATPKPLQLPEGASVTVQTFRFSGNALLTEAALQRAVQPWRHRAIGFHELLQAAQAVADAYAAAGWIVRTFLPEQDVTDGTVTIQIVEAVFAGAHIEGEASSRVPSNRILDPFTARQAIGQPLSAPALDRALLLANDLPGVGVTGSLEQGQRNAETALALQVRDKPLVGAEVGVDNSGARATGNLRTTLGANVNSPLKLGDQLRTDVLLSQGVNFWRLGYSLPVGRDGWRLGANTSALDYHLTAPDFAALNGRGNSTSTGLDLSYPLLRSRLSNLYLSFAFDHKHFHNEASAVTQSDYAIDDWTAGLSGNLYDALWGGGTNSYALSLVQGSVNQGTLDTGENPAFSGTFRKLRYSLSRTQVLTQAFSLYGAYSGHYAHKDLDSAERFYLGGPDGVRAYPVNEGGGSSGTLARAELRWQPDASLTLSGFFDQGRVANDSVAPSYALKGHGLSLAWLGPQASTLRATWARRDGDNPNPTSTGMDQDGSLVKDRFWFSLSMPFSH